MRLAEIYKKKKEELNAGCFLAQKPVISYEIFPPKGEGQELEDKINNLINELKILSAFNPAYISVTYGAGGSTREKTFDIVNRIKDELGITPMPHFTCVGANKNEILKDIKFIDKAGIKNILALRGDPPKGEKEFKKPENGFGYANELVEFIKTNTDLSIAVAGYPEGHQECISIETDIKNLKRKVDAGADTIITQVFYDNAHFLKFRNMAEEAGITVPIIPGILPITNISQVQRMTELCGTQIPETLVNRLKEHQDNPEKVKMLGIEFAIYQCQQLLDAGVAGIHFYTLNKAFAVKSVLENLAVELAV